MIFGGLLAGGTGSRMETASMPKQFIRVDGVPIFIRSLRTFLSVEEIDTVVISTNVEWNDYYIELIREFDLDEKRIVLTPGGNTRFTSMVNVCKKAMEIADKPDSLIITHDCARIFVNKRILLDNIAMAQNYDMVTTSIPTIDTMLQSDDGFLCSGVPDRSKLWCDQGPQTFFLDRFLRYVSMIPEEDIPNYIEAGKVYLSHNRKIGIVRGERFNFKITNDIDLQYAEFLIKQGVVK
jgi:2-C-methyl-D-erythritol 4-phosphate cytidylyltransferase